MGGSSEDITECGGVAGEEQKVAGEFCSRAKGGSAVARQGSRDAAADGVENALVDGVVDNLKFFYTYTTPSANQSRLFCHI